MMAPRPGAHTAQTPTVEQRVRAQAAFIASAAFHVFLPFVLVTLVIASAWTGWVNVMAMHTYLDRPGALPGVEWAVPVAVQTFVIAGEATMVLNSILRRRWIMISGAAAAVAGYGAETCAHVHYGAAPDTTVTMIVSAVACGGGWALVAALMRRGVEIANDEAAAEESPDEQRPGAGRDVPSGGRPADATADEPDPAPESAPTASAATGPITRGAKRRRTRAELLAEVRALSPDRPTLSPNHVATRIGVSWASAKSLLTEAGRLAAPESNGPAFRRAEGRGAVPAAWSAPRAAWSAGRHPR
ncbi:hypothetical protein [Streptomyces marincola]|uniref:DUF2637 domain-containing protein n=1 Tax=Streptomyces marincola TaxID=2878388 RepID=A0A1W7CWJ0_9ACTN|nr:hypothetical protein [Streptomyces marincola]ARQ69158.1 hypothetical protein CAG99_10045 [Streptomyces marincola]